MNSSIAQTIQKSFIQNNNLKKNIIYKFNNITSPEQQLILSVQENNLEIMTSLPSSNSVETVEFSLSQNNLNKIITGEITLQLAYMTGKLQITGNPISALLFNQLFNFRV